MSHKKQLLVFHRNCLFRDCLARYLTDGRGHEATPVDHLQSDRVDQLLGQAADALLLDLNLPDRMAVEIARAVRDRNLNAKVIILVPDQHDSLVECIAAGAHGCVLERAGLDDLDEAIEKVLRGETFCAPEIVATMFEELSRFNHLAAPSPPRPKATRLTDREQEVLDLLDKRKSNKQIASELCVSLFTVKNHVHNILDKLNVDSRSAAVELAREQSRITRSHRFSTRQERGE